MIARNCVRSENAERCDDFEVKVSKLRLLLHMWSQYYYCYVLMMGMSIFIFMKLCATVIF